MINFYNIDNLLFMKDKEDNAYDLAIIDPPYGLNIIGKRPCGTHLRKDGSIKHGIDKRNGSVIVRKPSKYKLKEWDKNPPPDEFFNEIFRISKNQIIFGANHFISKMPFNSSCWIVWDKVNGNTGYADCELAYTSFKKATRMFSFMWNGMLQGSSKDGKTQEGNYKKRIKRIHPTEKPVQLYRWILKNFASNGDKIIDTHGGSMSIAIACYMEGFDIDICEIDKEYFNDAVKRYKQKTSQLINHKIFKSSN